MNTEKHGKFSEGDTAEPNYSIRIEKVGLEGNTPIPPVRQTAEKLKKYEDSARTLTVEQIERMVLSVASGRNSYRDICEAVPGINSATVQDYLRNTPPPDSRTLVACSNYLFEKPYKKAIIEFTAIPKDYAIAYEFKETDTFKLTVDGENIRYRLRKEQVEADRYEETMKYNKDIKCLTTTGIIVGIIAIIVTIAIAYITR